MTNLVKRHQVLAYKRHYTDFLEDTTLLIKFGVSAKDVNVALARHYVVKIQWKTNDFSLLVLRNYFCLLNVILLFDRLN